MCRLIVTGSKNFNNYPLLKQKLDDFLKDKDSDVVIVSGEADGVETLSEKYAVERFYDICCFPIHWTKYGKKAAFIRNELMFNFANNCLIFWDGKSNDTGYTVGAAKKYGIEYKVIRY
ncbi:SLOG family protein [Neobacillus drentensis]|uniref:SLOG family protein n=1 Tax=Neobacillus drentensis TaxID=220684 RepID=UPI002FFF0E1C